MGSRRDLDQVLDELVGQELCGAPAATSPVSSREGSATVIVEPSLWLEAAREGTPEPQREPRDVPLARGTLPPPMLRPGELAPMSNIAAEDEDVIEVLVVDLDQIEDGVDR